MLLRWLGLILPSPAHLRLAIGIVCVVMFSSLMSCRLWAKQRRWADMKATTVDLDGVAAISVPQDLRLDPDGNRRTGDYAGFRFQRVNGHHLNGMTSYAEGLDVYLIAADVDDTHLDVLASRGTFDNFGPAKPVKTERGAGLNITVLQGDYSRDPVHEPMWCLRLIDVPGRIAMTWWGYKKQYTPELARDNLVYARSRLKITGDVGGYLQNSRTYDSANWTAARDQNIRALNEALRGIGFETVNPGVWSHHRDVQYIVDNGRPQQFHLVQPLGHIPVPNHPLTLTGPVTLFKFIQNFWWQDNQGSGGGQIPNDYIGELTSGMDREQVYFFRIHSFNLWKPLDAPVASLLNRAIAEGDAMRKQFEAGKLVDAASER